MEQNYSLESLKNQVTKKMSSRIGTDRENILDDDDDQQQIVEEQGIIFLRLSIVT